MQTFLQQYGLLVAVAVPVLVIVGMQVLLFVSGERGTLLLPSLKPFDSIALSEDQPIATPVPAPTVMDTDIRGHRLAASYDEREAA
jgi:hypothetical protein